MATQEQDTESDAQRIVTRFREYNLIPRELEPKIEQLAAQDRHHDALRVLLDAKDD